VTVTQGTTRGTADLSEPEREAPVRKYWGKCECGCGSDLYSNGHVPKRFLNEAHRMRAVRRAKPAKPEERKYLGKCECGCGSDVYGSKYAPQMKYVNKAHQIRANNAREARSRAARAGRAAEPQDH
jgi:hypothetical protein